MRQSNFEFTLQSNNHLRRSSTIRKPDTVSPISIPDRTRVKCLQRQRTIKQKLKPLNFKSTHSYSVLESTLMASEQMQRLEDSTFDFTSEEGQGAIKSFLEHLESLALSMKVKTEDRTYRCLLYTSPSPRDS